LDRSSARVSGLHRWPPRRSAQRRTQLSTARPASAPRPDILQRRFLDTTGTTTNDGDTITITLSRRAYSPVLRRSDLRADTTISWWQNRRLRFHSPSRRRDSLHANPR